jgi:hypothetical protein
VHRAVRRRYLRIFDSKMLRWPRCGAGYSRGIHHQLIVTGNPLVVMPAFHRFPNEAAMIGRLLAGYAELEIGLLHCVSVVREDFDAVLKSMFRTRGETRRIDVADALGRQLYRGE